MNRMLEAYAQNPPEQPRPRLHSGLTEALL